jgi:hypothetical protein
MSVLWSTLLVLALTPPVASAHTCPDQPTPRQPPFEITVPAGQWLHAELAEDGTDWVLVGIAGGRRFEHDSAPSRLASERLLLPGAWFEAVRIETRAYGRHAGPAPPVQVHCRPLTAEDTPRWQSMLGGLLLAQAEQSGIGPALRATLRAGARDWLARAAQSTGDPLVRAGALHSIGYLKQQAGDWKGARASYLDAAQAWAGQRPQAARAARFHAAQTLMAAGRYPPAAEELEALLADPALAETPFLEGWVRNDLCLARRELDQPEAASACLAALARWHRAHGAEDAAALALCNEVSVLAGAHRWEAAEARMPACAQAQRRHGNAGGQAYARHLEGWLRLHRGDWRGAAAELEAALKHFDAHGPGQSAWQVRALLARAWLMLDEAPRAYALLRAGIERVDRQRDPDTHARLLAELGRLLGAVDPGAARPLLEDAAALYARSGGLRMAAAARCDLAVLGFGEAPERCALGAARMRPREQVTDAEHADWRRSASDRREWIDRLRWLDRVVATADTDARRAATLALLDEQARRAHALPPGPGSERVRSALLIELAAAYARLSLAADDAAAQAALHLARAAGPPLSAARSLLLVAESTAESVPARTAQPEAPPASAPPGVVELYYLPGLDEARWLLARGPRIEIHPAPAEAALRPHIEGWLALSASSASGEEWRARAATLAGLVGLTALRDPADTLWLVHTGGAAAEIPWPLLPDPAQADAPLGLGLTVLARGPGLEVTALQAPLAITTLVAVDPKDLPPELPGARHESLGLASLAQRHERASRWLALSELRGGKPRFEAGTALLLGGHAVADRELGDGALLGPRAQSGQGLGPTDFEGWPQAPELLILGACESAGGPTRRYFGDFGLATAAARSGAPWVLGYRWPIDDMAAVLLHQSFLDSLLGGASPPEALREATTTLATSRRHAHPRHWAGVVLLASGGQDPALVGR